MVDAVSSRSLLDPVFSCRIVDIDSYLVPPLNGWDATYSEFSGEPIKKVPIIRIFGATPCGQKSCVHVHGVYPYLYVPCMKENPTESYFRQFGRSIDHALQVSLGVGSREDKHVFKISIFKGLPFYGYHESERMFLKIHLYNPSHVKRLAELLVAGAIMNVPLQAYESHIPFVLQFMIDYNLYGMSYMNSSKVMFRIGEDHETNAQFHLSCSLVNTPPSPNLSHHQVWKTNDLPIDMVLHEARVSTCELEVDINVEDILNKQDLENNQVGEYPGLVSLWKEELKRRETLCIDDRLSPPPSPDRVCSLIHEAEGKHRTELFDIIDKRCSVSPLLNDIELTPPVIDMPTEDQPLSVDEDVIDYRMKLSRKLSSISFNSSEAEIVDVLADLVQSSDLHQTLTVQSLSETLLTEKVSTSGGSGGSEVDLFHEDNLSLHEASFSLSYEQKIVTPSTQSDQLCSIERNNVGDSVLSQLLSRSNFAGHLEELSHTDDTNITSTQLSYENRKHVVQLCMNSGDEEEEEEDRDDDEEEEMTQPLIDDRLYSDNILQLDGSRGRTRKRSLGLSRKRTRAGYLVTHPKPKPELVESKLKAESVQSELKTNSVELGPKPESVESGLKPKSVESSLKPESVESGLKPESVESELKLESVESELKPESVESELEPESVESGLKPESVEQGFKSEGFENVSMTLEQITKRKRSQSITGSSECSDTTLSCTPPSILAKRALSSSLFPKIPKLSRKDSEKYLMGMKEQTTTPCHKRRKQISTSKSSTDKSSGSKSSTSKSKSPSNKPFISKPSASRKPSSVSSNFFINTLSFTRSSKRLKTRPIQRYDLVYASENEMLSHAMADSLITYQMEQNKFTDKNERESCVTDQQRINVIDQEQEENAVIDLRQDDDIVTDPHQVENIVTDPHQEENIVTDPHQEENIVTDQHQEENTVIDLHQDDNIVTDPHQVENIVTDPHQEENIVTDPLQEENIVTDLHLDDNTVIYQVEYAITNEGEISVTDQVENSVTNQAKNIVTDSRENVLTNTTTDQGENTVADEGSNVISCNQQEERNIINIDLEKNTVSNQRVNSITNLCVEEKENAGMDQWDSNVSFQGENIITDVDERESNTEEKIEMELTHTQGILNESFFIIEPDSCDEDSPIKLTNRDSSDTSSEFQLILSSESDFEEPQPLQVLELPFSSVDEHHSTSGTVSWPIGTTGKCILQPQLDPPSLHIDPSFRHCKPFYSNPMDTQPPQDYGGYKVRVPSLMPYELPEFDCSRDNGLWCTLEHWKTVLAIHKGLTNVPSSSYLDKGNKEPYTVQQHQEDIMSRSQYWHNGSCVISPLKSPPDPIHIKNQLVSHSIKLQTPSDDNSHLDGPSLDNTYGFQFTPTSTTDTTTDSEVQFITQMSVELHIRTRFGLRPDPEWDPVLALFYYIHNDFPSPNNGKELTGVISINLIDQTIHMTPTKGKSPAKKSPTKLTKLTPQKYKGTPQKYKESPQKYRGSPQKYPSKNFLGDVLKMNVPEIEELSVSTDTDVIHPYLEHCGLSTELTVTYVNSEIELFNELIKLVRKFDPDILLGYEVQKGSWGYLKSRSNILGINLIGQIGRVPVATVKHSSGGKQHSSEINVQGRIIMNIWRILRHEISLTSYTFENIAYHVLHQRVPKFSYQILTEWFEYRNRLYRSRVVDYYMTRCYGNFQLLEKLNLIGRTSEMARLYGIEFHNVLARGSQYRVESMMLRLAKQYNYVAASPSVQQRARMAAPECLPLIMEPESKFYSDPVLVLDFQSLYPSMVIAYNYCFSTCLGRVKQLANDGDFVFGACSLNISRQQLKQLKDHVTISPNGIVFVKPEIRHGVLPQMLEKILNTRIMVKQSMKIHKHNKILQRILDARQLGLKLIANVTYGYTAASYSGRMPCVEIADSIVRKGRETLERAIHLVSTTEKWRARVVYGDTDSMFILLKGATKEEAFRIGNEISKAVTAINPKPVKLKFEKVYLPCILQTKKRYVGYSYESLNQSEPLFDAKGIETVRRDGCPAASKVLEKSLKLLFSTKDVSLVKSYVQRQCCKILDGKISLQDYVFAKEYRGHRGYRPGACVPALELARKMVSSDRQAEPLVGERVPYVIVYDSPGLPLIQLVRRLDEVASTPSLHINSNYYITKQIMPPLDRSFSLLGVNVFQWYTQLPRTQRSLAPLLPHAKRGGTISQYFSSLHCPICESLTTTGGSGVCEECSKKPHQVVITLLSHIQRAQRNYLSLCQLCQNCCGNISGDHFMECISLDCPVLHSRQTSLWNLSKASSYQRTIDNFSHKHSLS